MEWKRFAYHKPISSGGSIELVYEKIHIGEEGI